MRAEMTPRTHVVDRLGTGTNRLDLGAARWRLIYSERVVEPASSLSEALRSGYRSIPARVPGSIELDLERAGEIEDPFIGDNVLRMRELEYGDWWYECEFEAPRDWQATGIVFHGLDTIADISLNGESIGSTRNMFIEHELRVSEAIKPGTNRLVVHLSSPMAYAEAFDYPAGLTQVWDEQAAMWIRKPAHMYGWDIAPRIVSAGIHRGVTLVGRADDRISDWYLRTVAIDGGHATVELHYELSAAPRNRVMALQLEAKNPKTGSTFFATVAPQFLAGHLRVSVDHPDLWFPRNYGEPHLYDVVLRLSVDGEVVDSHESKLGIRLIDHDYVALPAPDGRFEFSVNAVPIMVLGTNWVSIDAIHSRDAERLPRALAELWESGVNAVRCWGGNLYEDREFFDWCDAHGILVWQDFALACGRYPQEEPFLGTLAIEATSIVRKLRSHASLLVWSGANETDDAWIADGLDPVHDVLTRKILPDAVRAHGWSTPYIEGSPSQPPAAAVERRLDRSPEQHLWGERAGFKTPFYEHSNAVFIGEIGIHGAVSASSIDRFMPPGRGLFDPADRMWTLHESDHLGKPVEASHLTLMAKQAELFFGAVDRASRVEFIPASQIHQAEAYKFFVENSRLTAGRTGVMWWNLIDCWPQVSASLVDYYFDRRLGFYYVRRAQHPVSIMATEAQGWSRDVVLVNDSSWSGTVEYSITAATDPDFCIRGAAHSDAARDTIIATLPLKPAGECYLFRWTVDGVECGNHYLEGQRPFDLGTYRETYLPLIADLDESFTVDSLWPTS